MHAMLQRNVDSGYITEEQAEYIQTAIDNHESLVIAGHRSAGGRPFMAALMALAKGQYETIQVKDASSIEEDAEYYLIPGLGTDDFADIITDALSKEGSSIVTLKEPEHPYSILKVMKDAYKKTGDASKVVTLLEARKIDGVPYLININRHFYNEKGKVKKEETPRTEFPEA